jgi:hypothetical protein
MPVPRSLRGLVTAGGKLYSVGGTLEMVIHSDTEFWIWHFYYNSEFGISILQ